MQRECVVAVRTSPFELRCLQDLAALEGLKPTEWVRAIIRQRAKDEGIMERIREEVGEDKLVG